MNLKSINNTKRKWIFFLSFSLITTISFVSLTSCSKGVDDKITSNMVDKGDGTKFSEKLSLYDQIKLALTDTTASNLFKDFVANEILYKFYYDIVNEKNNDHRNQEWNNYKKNWDDWQKAAEKSYDDKWNTYKTSHGNNAAYYFQNEVLDPMGIDGTLVNPITNAQESEKESFVRLTMYGNVRSDFTTKVFERSYLGLPKKNGEEASYADFFNNDLIKGDINSIDTLLYEKPELWQTIDFYPSANPNYYYRDDLTGYYKNLDWMWAYLQHFAFILYTYSVNPVSTVMVLWKGLEDKTKFNQIYNVKDDTKNPAGTVPTDAKVGYNFPVFDDTKWNNFAIRLKTDLNSENPTSNFIKSSTGLINVPVSKGTDYSYTDDSATLIKVNLSTDAFTTLDVTFSAATSYLLWNLINTGNKMTSINSSSSSNNNGIINSSNLLENFIFPTTIESSSSSSYTVKDSSTHFQNTPKFNFLGDAYECEDSGRIKIEDNQLKKIVDSSSSEPDNNSSVFLDQQVSVFNYNTSNTNVPHAEVFNHASKYYKEGYVALQNAYQIGDKPFMLIRERSGGDKGTGGVHFIAIDGYEYIAPIVQEKMSTRKGILRMDTPSRNIRDKMNDVLKVRCLANQWNDDRYAGSFNFVTTDLKTFFTQNLDEIVLLLALASSNSEYSFTVNGIAGSTYDIAADYKSLFGSEKTLKDFHIFSLPNNDKNGLYIALWQVELAIDKLKIYESTVKNLHDSFDKLIAFNSAEITNDKWNGINGIHNKTKFYPINDIYKNGLACQFPFSRLSNITTQPFAVEVFILYYFTSLFSTFSSQSYNLLLQNVSSVFESQLKSFIEPKARPKSGNAFYSEHIFTNNGAINAALNSFGVSDKFANSLLLDSSLTYLNKKNDSDSYKDNISFLDSNNIFANIKLPNEEVTTEATQLNLNSKKDLRFSEPSYTTIVPNSEEEFTRILANNIYIPKVAKSYNDLVRLQPSSLSDFLTKATNLWKTTQLATGDWGTNISDISSYSLNQIGTSPDKISYWKTIETIKYLMTDDEYNFNPKHFIDWFSAKVQFGQPAFFVWNVKDSIDYNPSFGTCPYEDFSWKSNFEKFNNSKFSNTVSSANYANPENKNVGWVENPNYLKSTKVIKDNENTTELMGFMGLLTSSNDNITKHGSENLFQNFKHGNDISNESQKGALARYMWKGVPINVKERKYWDFRTSSVQDITSDVENSEWFKNSLTGHLYLNRSVSNTKAVAKIINDSVTGFEEVYELINSNIDPYDKTLANTDGNRLTQALISAIFTNGWKHDPYKIQSPVSHINKVILNEGTDTTLPSFPLTYPMFQTQKYPKVLHNERGDNAENKGTVFLNEMDSTNNASEVMYCQIDKSSFLNYSEYTFTKPTSKDDYLEIYFRLLTDYGASIIDEMIYEAAQDPINTNEAGKKERALYTKDGKIKVYDRRLNDKLGTLWVDGFKEKN